MALDPVTFTHVFADPDRNSIVDFVNPLTGLSAVQGNTLEQVRRRCGSNVQILTWEAWSAIKAARQEAPVEWLPTDEARYNEMLNVLPPVCWTSFGFMVGEPIDHHAGTGRPRYDAFLQRRDGTYWYASRPLTTQEFREILKLGEGEE